MKRTRELKPLTSEHHQALLVAFQLKKGLAGHAESAGAPRDLPGRPALARRFVFITGDTANPDAWTFLEGAGVPMIEKPFPPSVLEDAVTRVLTSPA